MLLKIPVLHSKCVNMANRRNIPHDINIEDVMAIVARSHSGSKSCSIGHLTISMELLVEKRRETHCERNREPEKRIVDDVESDTAVAR